MSSVLLIITKEMTSATNHSRAASFPSPPCVLNLTCKATKVDPHAVDIAKVSAINHVLADSVRLLLLKGLFKVWQCSVV